MSESDFTIIERAIIGWLRDHAIWVYIGSPISMIVMLLALGIMLGLMTARKRNEP